MNHRVVAICAALALTACASPCVFAQYIPPGDVDNSRPTRQQTNRGTHTQSYQNCEAKVNEPGGNPGRSTYDTGKQFASSYLVPGTYDVYEKAWQNGDTQLGTAVVRRNSPGTFVVTSRTDTKIFTYCYTIDGNPVFGFDGRLLRFNKIDPAGTGYVVYDAWWLDNKNQRIGHPQSWKLRQ